MHQRITDKWYLAPIANGAKKGANCEENGANRDAQAPNGAVRTCPRALAREGLVRFWCEMVSVYYEIDGERYPRVTAICAIVANLGLAYWRGSVGNTEADRVSREATTLGTFVHKQVERYIKQQTEVCEGEPCGHHPCAGWLTTMAANAQPLVRAYVAWHDEHIRAVVACEKLTVSRLHRYAGTVDLVAVLDDDPWPTVIDVKTSNSVSDSWGLQTAAYQLALDEEGIECGRRVIVQLPSKEPGVCHIHDLGDGDRDQRAFINALKLYRWKETLKPPEPKGPRIRFGGQR